MKDFGRREIGGDVDDCSLLNGGEDESNNLFLKISRCRPDWLFCMGALLAMKSRDYFISHVVRIHLCCLQSATAVFHSLTFGYTQLA